MSQAAEKIDAERLLKGLRAVAEPTRLRILALCARGDLTVSELIRILDQSQPRISRHLRLLVDAGVLQRYREGSWVFHRLPREGAMARLAHELISRVDEGDPALVQAFLRLAEVKAERAEAAQAYFSRNAERWNELRKLYVDEREVEGLLLDMLGQRPLGRVLDVGTGSARILEVLAPHLDHGEGIDLSHEMLTVARTNLERAGLANCTVRQADMYDLPFDAGSFDAVTIHQVLHFADEPGRAIAEATRVLVQGGSLLVADFAPHELEPLREEHEHRRLGFSDTEVASWFRAAGIETAAIRNLPGDPLTVTIWRGLKKPLLEDS
ncbi:MAG: metalloregulator ArsR/SmtB family transcription factor [Rhodospirillales bacterium]|jgi:ubiquinone/menaquinone biosynthesis C-methylase UbiE|nr:metalloregulator ArsR/SmtB family transcription factor [Rhodospirillales bacterium]